MWIRLHCTKALLEKLRLEGDGRLQSRKAFFDTEGEEESPLSGWHANLIKVQRRQCVVFVHDATRFPVFIPALSKPDLAELDRHFIDGFLGALLNAGADAGLIEKARRALGGLFCDTFCNRSVQGTMNQMVQELKFMLYYHGCAVADAAAGGRINLQLAESPRTVKGEEACLWPIQAMTSLLRASDL